MQSLPILLNKFRENPLGMVLLAAILAGHWFLARRLGCDRPSRNALYGAANVGIAVLLGVLIIYTAPFWGSHLRPVLKAIVMIGVAGLGVALGRAIMVRPQQVNEMGEMGE